jgi:predicted transcriptional regulator
MTKREFTLTQKGKSISLFYIKLWEDHNFKPNEPMTDTYIQEICYEAGLSKEGTLELIDDLVGMGIIR